MGNGTRWLLGLAAVGMLATGCNPEQRDKAKKEIKERLDKHAEKLAKKKAERAAKHALEETGRRHEQSLQEPTGPKVPGSGFAAGTELQIASVRIELNKDKKYDPDSLPDPKIDVRIDGESIGKCKHQDTLVLRCHLRWATFRLQPETEIFIAVADDDLLADDKIGVAVLAHLTKQGQADTPLPMRVTGGVAKAWVTIEKAPRVSKLKARIYGGIAGVVFSLLLIALFRGYLFDESRYLVGKELAPKLAAESQKPPRDPNVAIKVRCPYCSALNDEDDTTCHDCGGKL